MTAEMPVADDRIDFGAWSRPGAARAPVTIVGHSSIRAWNLDSRARIERLAGRREHGIGDALPEHGTVILCDARYWFEPGLLDWCAVSPGRAVLDGARAVIVHVCSAEADAVRGAMQAAAVLSPATLRGLIVHDRSMFFAELSKREAPVVFRLDVMGRDRAERLSFAAAYRGVSDLVTRFVWPRPAFHLTRVAARIGLSPNHVTAIGTGFALLACGAWWSGWFSSGIVCTLLFMLLDTVDGKLARCTVRSSRIGDVFDHGVDVAFPPLAWIAWSHGAGWSHGTLTALVAIICLYLVQRAAEAAFIAITGIQIHHWRPFDSRFKLITAQRNIQVPIAAIAYPIAGAVPALWALVAWSTICLAIHAGRLVTAVLDKRRGVPVRSWLSEPVQPAAS